MDREGQLSFLHSFSRMLSLFDFEERGEAEKNRGRQRSEKVGNLSLPGSDKTKRRREMTDLSNQIKSPDDNLSCPDKTRVQ